MGHSLTMLGAWVLAPVPSVGLVVSAALYLLAVRRVDRRTPSQAWPVRERVCFLAGLATVAVAVLGPPGAYDDTFFYAHMTQHILLTMVAAPLLVLGDPVLLVLRVAGRDLRTRRLVPLYRSRTLHVLANPVFGWLLFVGVMVVSHIPGVYDYALAHPLVHDYVEHPVYLFSALVFFYPLLSPTAGPHHVPEGLRVLSMFTVMVPMAFLGFFVYAAPRLAYPFYAHVDRPFGPGPLADQRLAGALMWSSSMLLGVVWVVVAGLNWLRAEERRGRRVDLAPVPVPEPPA
ncbi:MAG: cytochrome c oxidase assembly protein [Nocardioidaceae bacterium]